MNRILLEQIKRNKQKGEFIYPYYGERSLAEVPSTILSIFGINHNRATLPSKFWRSQAQNCTKVIVFFVDGLGYHQFFRYSARYPLFKRFMERGEVFPITLVFPSTTAAGLTTMHTGLTPQEHGLPEWIVYFEEFDKIIATISFNALSQGKPDSLLQQGGTQKMLYEGTTIYEKLEEKRVKSFSFLPKDYAESTYSQVSQKGSVRIPYEGVSDLATKLQERVRAEQRSAYFFVYWPKIDKMSHLYGPAAKETYTEASLFSQIITEEFLKKFSAEEAENILVVLTADHGQVSIDPENITYLNRYSEITDLLSKDGMGNPIGVTGSPRDGFLFVEPQNVKKIMRRIENLMGKNAEIISTKEAIENALFGTGRTTERFKRRIGDILILPKLGHEIWYEHDLERPFSFLGHHGGLSEEEMIIPFAIVNMAKLL